MSKKQPAQSFVDIRDRARRLIGDDVNRTFNVFRFKKHCREFGIVDNDFEGMSLKSDSPDWEEILSMVELVTKDSGYRPSPKQKQQQKEATPIDDGLDAPTKPEAAPKNKSQGQQIKDWVLVQLNCSSKNVRSVLKSHPCLVHLTCKVEDINLRSKDGWALIKEALVRYNAKESTGKAVAESAQKQVTEVIKSANKTKKKSKRLADMNLTELLELAEELDILTPVTKAVRQSIASEIAKSIEAKVA